MQNITLHSRLLNNDIDIFRSFFLHLQKLKTFHCHLVSGLSWLFPAGNFCKTIQLLWVLDMQKSWILLHIHYVWAYDNMYETASQWEQLESRNIQNNNIMLNYPLTCNDVFINIWNIYIYMWGKCPYGQIWGMQIYTHV